MSKKAPRKAHTAQPKIPVQLLALVRLIDRGSSVPGELRDAYAAAFTQLSEEPGEYPNQIHAYIDRYARTGPFREAVKQAESATSKTGDLHNAYGTPALLAGIAAMYLLLRGGDGGAR